MALNLGMLGYFKYYNFFAESLQAALARAGVHVSLAHLNVVLPIGISFYTFQSMSYVIDVYRRDIKPTRNFIEFAAFVSFFPHLVAGPIMRPTTLLPQIEQRRRFDLQQFYQGCVPDLLGPDQEGRRRRQPRRSIVNDLFGQWETIDGGLALLAIYAFAFQIYCDFSGYTDAARGIAKCLGFELALNFNLPYFATSPQDFWTRWHISLSTWLRDYLYIPLGGSRGGTAQALPQPDADDDHRRPLARRGLDVRALGLLSGRPARRAPAAPRPGSTGSSPTEPIDRACWKVVRIVATFHMVCFGWLLFRAQSMAQVVGMLRAIVERPAIPASSYLLPVAVVILPLLLYQVVQYVSEGPRRDRADPLVRPERLLHGLLLRLRARGRVRRQPVHLLPVLKGRPGTPCVVPVAAPTHVLVRLSADCDQPSDVPVEELGQERRRWLPPIEGGGDECTTPPGHTLGPACPGRADRDVRGAARAQAAVRDPRIRPSSTRCTSTGKGRAPSAPT